MGRCLSRCWWLLALGGITAASPAAAQAPDAVLLELRLPPDRRVVVRAARAGDSLWLPLVAVLQVADVHIDSSRSGAWRFVRPGDGAALRVDPSTGTLVAPEGVMARALAVDDVPRASLLLPAAALERALGVTLAVDWGALTVTFLGADALPPAVAARRSARHRQALQAEPPPPVADGRQSLARPVLTGGTIDYLVTIPDAAPIGDGSHATALGLSVLGGALEVVAAGDLGGRTTDVTASWLGVWRDVPWMEQVRLGDGALTGPRGLTVRGFSATNAPFLRPLDYGVLPLRALGGAGWEVESVVNGRLVRVDTIRGPADVVPLASRYGGNVVQLTAYGPGGQIAQAERFVSLDAQEFLPSGRFEYGLSAGACRFSLCEGAGNVDARYGVTSRLSVRAGLDGQQEVGGGAITARPYAGAAALLSPALTFAVLGTVDSEGSAVLRWQPTLDHAVILERTSQPSTDVFGAGLGGSERTNASVFLRPSWWDHRFFVNALWRRDARAVGTSERARLGVGVRTPVGQVFPFAAVSRGSAEPLGETRSAGASVFVTPSARRGRWLSRFWFGGSAEWRTGDAVLTQSTLAYQAAQSVRAELLWSRGPAQPRTVGVRIYSDLPRARVISAGTVESDGRWRGAHQVQGALFIDAARRQVSAVRGPLLLRGGVGGRVFLDLDGDGVLGEGDTPLAGVSIRVGASAAVTDEAGWYRVWDVLPFEPVLLEVESGSLPSPLWVPAFTRLEVAAGPSGVRRVDVPVLAGGVVEGRVVRSGEDSVGVGGATVVLRREDGRRVSQSVTFSDGGLLVIGLAPGTYRAEVEGWTVVSGAVLTVQSTARGDRITDARLVVRRDEGS